MITMSNLVIWSLLGAMILRTLDRVIRNPLATIEVEKERESHPLILYIEDELKRLFKPAGGMSCPELEKHILEMRMRSPDKLEELVRELVVKYYRSREKPESKPLLEREIEAS